MYNALSLTACGCIAYGYFKHGKSGPKLLGSGSPTRRSAGFLLQALGLVGISQLLPRLQMPVAMEQNAPTASDPSYSASSPKQLPATLRASAAAATDTLPLTLPAHPRCPMDFNSDRNLPADGVFGIRRVSRHPQLWGLGLLGLGSACTAAYAAEALCFGMPLVFAAVGGAHQDSRYRRGMGGKLTPEVDAVTSAVPFVALVTGRQGWGVLWEELKKGNAAVAVAGAGLLALRRGR
ncbi:unnamed protein product [Chrysoparadoxa australica]